MSAARRKKTKRFVIDTNVWVSYCINGELIWLTKYIVQNRLLVYASPMLLQEIKKVLQYAKVKKLLASPLSHYTQIIEALVLLKDDSTMEINSPDANDDFLFALAIDINAKVIVCGDKDLLNWKESPVKLISKTAFESLY